MNILPGSNSLQGFVFRRSRSLLPISYLLAQYFLTFFPARFFWLLSPKDSNSLS